MNQAKEDSGTLERVADRKSDKHPEFEGEFKIRCPHCGGAALGWVKAWVRERKEGGGKYFALAFKHRQRREAANE